MFCVSILYDKRKNLMRKLNAKKGLGVMNSDANKNDILIEKIDKAAMKDERRKRMMAYLERINLCRRVKEADMQKMSELVERMKGEGRSYNQYSKDMGVAASSLTRISKQTVSSVSNELLAKLAEHMDPECGVTFEELITANGLIEDDRRSFIESARQFEQDAEDIIRKDLYRANKMVMKVDRQEYVMSRFGRIAVDFVIKTDSKDCDNELWAFDIKYIRERGERYSGLNSDARFMSMRLMETISTIMSELYVGTNIKKWSIVINREDLFDMCVNRIEERLNGRKLKDKISLILVDTEKRFVSKEWTIPTDDGAEDITVFPCKPEEINKDDIIKDDYYQYDLFHRMYDEGSDET